MEFNNPSDVESICWQMREADYARGKNRERINNLFNGWPPFTPQEVADNNITVNFNDLTSTRVAHDARAQFYSAFMKPGNYFRARSDMGPIHKRDERSQIVTREVNHIMKRSLPYFECNRSEFALNVLHGIGPSAWDNQYNWCPEPKGIEDILIPAGTFLTMKNLPFFAIYRSFTAPELIKLTRNVETNSGWNMPLVKACIEWVDQESKALMGTNWPEMWTPEKVAERVKGDGGFYTGDQVPTINCFDFYFYREDEKSSGWNRRIILDAWSTPDGNAKARLKGKLYDASKNQFLFNSKKRSYGAKREELISFQFADLSSVAPFRYHSVRSLGFLLFSVCHIQNRLRCKFTESVFEALMMLFRVRGSDDVERAIKVQLANRGFVDDSVQFIPANERFQVNANLVELGLRENTNLIEQSASTYSQRPERSAQGVEKTKYQVMAEINATGQLVSAGLLQAYQYKAFQYFEIFRRFCKKNSKDVDVQRFQARCLQQGVPESMLTPEAWDIEPERISGAGNKTMELGIAEWLMENRNLYDPEPQREILRHTTLAVTDDPGLTKSLVPEVPVKMTDTVLMAQMSASSLMMGLPVGTKTGINHIEYVETMLTDMAIVIKKISQRGMAKPDEIDGLQNMAIHIAEHIKIIAQDENEKQRVKQYGDTLGKLMNAVKGFAQRLQEQMQSQNGSAKMDPKDQAKIMATQALAQAKIQNTRESHAARTVQRQIQFERDEQRKSQSHALEMQQKIAETTLELKKKAAETGADIQLNRLKALDERKNKPNKTTTE